MFHHSTLFFHKKKKANEGIKGWGCLPLASLIFFNLCFISLKKNLQMAARPKPQVLGAFLWGINCTFFCEELGTKAALLSSASCLCQNLNAQSDGRIYPWGLLVPPWRLRRLKKRKKNVTELSRKQTKTIKPRALNVTGSVVFNVSVFLISEKVPIKYSPVGLEKSMSYEPSQIFKRKRQ